MFPPYLITPLFLALLSTAQINLPFDPIFSVHPDENPRCPPDYTADGNYKACCSRYATLTTAFAPGHIATPACCNPDAVNGCTGAAPIMYDWSLTTDTILSSVGLVTVTPGPATKTGGSTAKPSSSGSGSNPNSNSNSNSNSNTININKGTVGFDVPRVFIALAGMLLSAMVYI
ncbi:hypothetical protein GP486_007562 [Trichoglossum hirsutum]|uniref:Uncharacterized protein n=1 Tax=Trichoglossum hirsutum TaxID=265104 RepID=A0A9P8IFL3_9PEZI|nr:hypothetical protein GP486_007562 [Trichoglossum hirsutum]